MKYLLTCALILTLSLTGGAQSKGELTADEFEMGLQEPGVQLVDVRTPDEYKKGRIAGSQNFNVNSPEFDQQIKTLDKSRPVYVYCLSGGRSATAAGKLRRMGFRQVYELKGGIMQWNEKKKPVEKPAGGPTGMSPAKFRHAVESEELVLVDFYARWCGPCKKMAPDLEALKTAYAGKMTLLKIDADANGRIIDSMKVNALPTLLIFKKGEKKWTAVGYRSRQQLEKALQAHF